MLRLVIDALFRKYLGETGWKRETDPVGTIRCDLSGFFAIAVLNVKQLLHACNFVTILFVVPRTSGWRDLWCVEQETGSRL